MTEPTAATAPKTRKPHTLKPYEITDANGAHVAYALAKSGRVAAELVAPPLTARVLTLAETASIDPGDFVREGGD